MKQLVSIRWIVIAWAAFCGAMQSARGEEFLTPLQLDPYLIDPNWASTNGHGVIRVPPTVVYQESLGLTTATATTNQFANFAPFSGVTTPNYGTDGKVLIPATGPVGGSKGPTSLAGDAVHLGLPQAHGIVLVRAAVGSPFILQTSTFLYGQVIPQPTNDIFGKPLTNIAVSDYWLAEPYSASNHVGDPFYWSPNAQLVFATQPGHIAITWQTVQTSQTEPTNVIPNVSYVQKGGTNGLWTTLYKQVFNVSGAAIKPAVQIYWNQLDFSGIGAQILVPVGTVVGVNVITNLNFPQLVTQQYRLPGSVPVTAGSTNQTLQELRTLWYDATVGSINAYNQEGRAFIEYYGNVNPDGTHQFLGYEIVDVAQRATPSVINVNLGDPLYAYANGTNNGLTAQPVHTSAFSTEVYDTGMANSGQPEFWAALQETNTDQLFIYWMQSASLGVLWPKLLDTYTQQWPADLTLYTQFIRSGATNPASAELSAVQLPSTENPQISYQDPLDQTRSFINAKSQFYTWLTPAYPAQRTLLRYNSAGYVYFERVFSWLDSMLDGWTDNASLTDPLSGGVTGVATDLNGYSSTNGTLTLTADGRNIAPRVVSRNALVGKRIEPPTTSETDPTFFDGLAPVGYINQATGTAFAVDAYVDPLVNGFTAAAAGTIIPVNANPANNTLEVWWFRTNSPPLSQGFTPVLWPAVVGYYTLEYDPGADQIVLASNHGSNPLQGLEAAGHIYIQNDSAQVGYNPNEEHALMQGGSAWALRDDLNITNGPNYTSEPFVLVEYTDSDGLPSIHSYRVVRETGQYSFSYDVTVGNDGGLAAILQPPMPLPLLPMPIGANGANLNYELSANGVNSLKVQEVALPSSGVAQGFTNGVKVPIVTITTTNAPGFRQFNNALLTPTLGGNSNFWLFLTSVDPSTDTVGGILTKNPSFTCNVSSIPPIELTPPTANQAWFFVGYYDRNGVSEFHTKPNITIPANQSTVVLVNTAQPNTQAVGTVVETAELFGVLLLVRVDLGTPVAGSWVVESDTQLALVEPVVGGGTPSPSASWMLANSQQRNNPVVNWSAMSGAASGNVAWPADGLPDINKCTYQDRNGTVWVYRGPHDVNDNPEFSMRFYYPTQPGFFFPQDINGNNLSISNQPPVGTITPYLRAPSLTTGGFVGDPITGTNASGLGSDQAFIVTYNPSWSPDVPVLDMAQTLTSAVNGLPAIRGNSSAVILYQQSQVASGQADQISAVLTDPTRAKTYLLGTASNGVSMPLLQLPSSVQAQSELGKTYFPQLPPHLVNRFYFDSTLGPQGGLVLIGQWINPGAGLTYILPNILTPNDVGYLNNLCNKNDMNYPMWTNSISGLSTTMVPFAVQDGQYLANHTDPLTVTWGPMDTCEVFSQETPVDSYALTAAGPGTGYVVLGLQDSINPANAGNPVTVQVVRVAPQLYAGDLNVIESSNPLSQYITLQQAIDLAGRVNSYRFDWRIAASANGAPPPIYGITGTNLLPPTATLPGPQTPWYQVLFPSPFDNVSSVPGLVTNAANRIVGSLANATLITLPVLPVHGVPVVSHGNSNIIDIDLVATNAPNPLVLGDSVVVQDVINGQIGGTVTGDLGVPTNSTPALTRHKYEITLNLVPLLTNGLYQPMDLYLAPSAFASVVPQALPDSILFNKFSTPILSNGVYRGLYLSFNLDAGLQAKTFIDGALVATANTGTTNDTVSVTPPADLNDSFNWVFQLDPSVLSTGISNGAGGLTHSIVVYLYANTNTAGGSSQVFDARVDASLDVDEVVPPGSQWLELGASSYPDGIRATLGGAASVQSLTDNWLTMRYQSTDPNNAAYGTWSRWTTPQLAPGYIDRVLAGINPFDQRITDLLNNSVNDQVSVLTQAGPRWEGNIALDESTLNNYGLIQIYETVLGFARNLSIDSGINYGPADDELLKVTGSLSDLYTILGNEGWAEANNPTISTGSNTSLASVSTSLFPFLGETATLLEQQQDQLRGRDDFEQPGVQVQPVYNRLYWNYTLGINSGEIIYALNFDVKPAPNNNTGVIGASDAEFMFPQGHGDAYGHYLTASFDYYKLLMNPNFSWVPQSDAVLVLGVPVLVNYMHETKFAQSAAALAQTGQLIYDLAWRSEYLPGASNGWANLSPTATNPQTGVTRYWGSDHWAHRVGQGEYVNWIVGNSLLPAVDPNTYDYGIQKVDRTTVTELQELPTYATALQTRMDNAEGRLNPLGLPENAIAFDINPNLVVGGAPQTHFEQIFQRAVQALDNAVYAFNQAQSVTAALRSQQDSLSDFVNQVNAQELSYTNQLIAVFGTPYSDDIGPGATYPQGYAGPDLIHYQYVDQTDLTNTASVLGLAQDPFAAGSTTLNFLSQTLPASYLTWMGDYGAMFDTQTQQGVLITGSATGTDGDITTILPAPGSSLPSTNPAFLAKNLTFTLDNESFISKPSNWVGERNYLGSVQQAIADYKQAWWNLYNAVLNAGFNIQNFEQEVAQYEALRQTLHQEFVNSTAMTLLSQVDTGIDAAKSIYDEVTQEAKDTITQYAGDIEEAVPTSLIAGLADGGDVTSPIRSTIKFTGTTAAEAVGAAQIVADSLITATHAANSIASAGLALDNQVLEWSQQLNSALQGIVKSMNDFNGFISATDIALRDYNTKQQLVQTAITQGNQILAQRLAYRAREAAIIQGYRTSDASFRLFQNEKLQRYNTLFDLAQQYAVLAANAYDYETGQLGSQAGKALIQQMISTRLLGVVDGQGNPQYAAPDGQGDPGLSSALAEMWADWSALKGRLGFNNPDGYGTVVSLRSENFRILPTSDGDSNWHDLLNQNLMPNVLADPDVKRLCLQIDPGNGLPVPGLVLSFSTTIADGLNLFGQPLAAGDHDFSESSFATKIYSVGVALDGYVGMDAPPVGGSVASGTGATPTDPSTTFDDPNALAATPYVYLIPVGVDSMRSPPLGDVTTVRTWNVADIAVPLPFNVGKSGFSTQPVYQASDSLQEALFAVRKHQAFRPVPASDYFNLSIYGSNGSLQPSQFTNRRLIGRSVWNSKWKLVIPGYTLLSDPNQGLSRLINSLKDVKLYFVTYSYAGN